MKKKYKISVIGLGYVGLQVGLAFSKRYETIGYDINKIRVSNLNKNFDETREVNSYQLKKSNIKFTNNINELGRSNFHIIAVPTPINTKKEPDLKILKKATKDVSSIIKDGDIIIYESTVYPGVTEEVCIPILEKYSNLKSNKNFYVGYSPERINPGDNIYSYSKINKLVSCQNNKILNVIHKLYQSTTKGRVYKVKNIKVAEAAKVIENTQRDLNVALINELSLIFKKMNISLPDVLEAANTKWNFLNFTPGLVGGHCIGVDPYYLTYKSKQVGINPNLILAGRKINDNMPNFIVSQILSNFKSNQILKINILGLTFKENCADTRNSKVLDIIKLLKKNGHILNLFDPYLDNILINKKKTRVKPIKNFKKADIIIIAVKHKDYLKLPNKFFINNIKSGGVIFDIKASFLRLNNKKFKKYKYQTL